MSDFLDRMKNAAKADKKTVVLPEGEDPRILIDEPHDVRAVGFADVAVQR